MKKRSAFAALCGLAMAAASASAQEAAPFSAADFEYGPRNDLADGETAEIWNPAKRKLMEGGPLFGGTIRATDPRTYCAMADAGYDFTWTEKQHEATDWEQVARMWRTCPGAAAAPGVRVAYADEREIQHATDSGALVIVVPTIDSVEEAREAVDWTYFPPMGRRSAGGGQGPTEMWVDVPGGYRQTWNDNVVLILMIETLEGVEEVREIAEVPGVHAIFAASGDLGNFSGYEEGDPEYEALITAIVDAAQAAGIAACGPLRWAGRDGFSCFQAGTEAAQIALGAGTEIAEAVAAFEGEEEPADAAASGLDVAGLNAQCATIVYEADCLAAVDRVLTNADELSDADRTMLEETLAEIVEANPGSAEAIRERAGEADIELGAL